MTLHLTTASQVEVADRVFEHNRIWKVSSDRFRAAATLLAGAAQDRYGPITTVVGIANGGLAVAAATSAFLHVPYYTVSARHNRSNEPYEQATGHVSCVLDELVEQLADQQISGRVLLVDDICGSGATLDVVGHAIDPYLSAATSVATAVLCRNTGACTDPDLWVWDVSDWVVFPWEPTPPSPYALLPQPTGVHPR